MATEKRTLDIEARVRDEMSRQLKKMGRNVGIFSKGSSKKLDRLRKSFFSVRNAAGALLAAFAVRRVFAGVNKVADGLDRLSKTSERLGVTVESLSALEHGIGLAGGEIGGLIKGLADLERNVEQARQGILLKEDAMKTLGLTMADFEGDNLDMVEILKKVADGYVGVESATQRTNAVLEIFGRQGKVIGSLLKGGSAGIEAFRKEAEEMGLVFTSDQAKKAAEYNDQLLRLTSTFKGMAQELFLEFAPTLSTTLGALKDFFRDNRDEVIEKLKDTARALGDFAVASVEILSVFAEGFKLAFSLAVTVTSGLEQMVIGVGLAWKHLSGGTKTEIAVYEHALSKAADKTKASTDQMSDAWGAAFDNIAGRHRQLRDLVDKIGKMEAKRPPTQGRSVTVFPDDPAQVIPPPIAAEFQRVIDDLTVRNLEGYQKQQAALDLRYEAEKTQINELAKLHSVHDADRFHALGLLRDEYNKTSAEIQGGFIHGLSEGLEGILEQIQDTTAAGVNLVNDLAGAITGPLDRAIGEWADGTKKLKDVWKDLGDSVVAELKRIIVKALVARAVGGIVGGALSFLQTDQKALGGVTRPIGEPVALRKFAKGGVAREPTVALFAETGRPEAFVPLPDGRTIPVTMSGGGAQTFITQVNQISTVHAGGAEEFLHAQRYQLWALQEHAMASRGGMRKTVRQAGRR